MKFDFAIGNPPYMETTDSESNRMPPVYNNFMDEAYKVANAVELITPARFLFNAGYTPKVWNEKMLNDEHFKVLEYEPDSSKIFSNTEIKGGIVITYRNENKTFGCIEIFTKYPDLNSILKKVNAKSNAYIKSIAFPPLSFGVSQRMISDYPDSVGRLRTSAFTKLSDIFYEERPNDDCEYIIMVGLLDGKRAKRYVRKDYILDKSSIINKWTVLLPEASGIGSFGEKTGSSIIAPPGTGFLQTFVGLGAFASCEEAENVQKYIKTKFCRAMLGILKITQHCSPGAWKYVPLQDFMRSSDIDWSLSISAIDQQLYKKYGLTGEEINFIEAHVKEMA